MSMSRYKGSTEGMNMCRGYKWNTEDGTNKHEQVQRVCIEGGDKHVYVSTNEHKVSAGSMNKYRRI